MRKHLTLESRSEMPKNAYDTQVASFQQPESVNTLTFKRTEPNEVEYRQRDFAHYNIICSL